MSISSKKRTKPRSTRLQKFGPCRRHLRRNSRKENLRRISETPTNGEVHTNQEATVYVHDLELFVTAHVLEDTTAVLSLGRLCEDHGYSHEWASGQKPHLTQNGRNIRCNTENYVPIVVPGLSTGASISTASASLTSLPQDSAEDSSSSPATIRRRSTSIPVLGNLLRDFQEWLEEFTENLEYEGVSASRDTPASASHASDSERPAKVVSRKHRIFTHFPKDRNCKIYRRTKITRAPCSKRTGDAEPRTENFGDLTASRRKSHPHRQFFGSWEIL